MQPFNWLHLEINHLLPDFFFVVFQDIGTQHKTGSFRLPTHSRDAHRIFFMIPS